jgi:hypothetical protein
MAFQIFHLFFCVYLIVMLKQRLRLLETHKEKAPFIFLFFIIVMLIAGYAAGAAYTRASATMDKVKGYALNAVAAFFTYVHVAFLPATMLWYIHNRGMILCDSAGKLLEPFTSTKRKRIFDWAHAGSTFGFLLALIAITTRNSISYEQQRISLDRYNTNIKVAEYISHACAALLITLYINVVASIILLNRRIGSVGGRDEVRFSITRFIYITHLNY